MFGDASRDKKIEENVDHVSRLQFPAYPDYQAFPCELIDNVQHAVFPAIMRPVFNEVIRPKMVWIFWA